MVRVTAAFAVLWSAVLVAIVFARPHVTPGWANLLPEALEVAAAIIAVRASSARDLWIAMGLGIGGIAIGYLGYMTWPYLVCPVVYALAARRLA